jgi:hypothetical protein
MEQGFAVPEILPMDAAAVEGLMRQAKQYEAFGFIPHAPEDFTPFVLDFSDAE